MTVYYHGTEARFLYPIAIKGFMVGEYTNGRVHGNGLYIGTRPETAGIWAHSSHDKKHYAIKCSLDPGTRIIWRDAEYDKKTIRSLEKKFGKDISKNYDFWKYIPHNKQVTSSELIALVSHLDWMQVGRNLWGKRRERWTGKKYRNLSRFSKFIRKYGYDALGDRTGRTWDSDDICIYNPSKVTPVSFHQIEVSWGADTDYPEQVDYSHPLSLEEIKKISAEDEADWQAFLGADETNTEI
jgi:hypothetical protein